MKTAWDMAPFLQKEGTFTGKVLRIRSLETIGGAQLLIRLDDTKIPEPPDHTADLEKLETRLKVASTDNADEILSAMRRLINIEQREIQDGTGSIKITIFYDGWKYTDDTGNSDEMDIEMLIRQLTPGTPITFRTSKNWRNSKIYCRYIKNLTTGFYSGYEQESTWKKETRTYDFVKKSGAYKVTILSSSPFIDDFERANLLLEICINDDSTFSRYCCIAPSSSDAYKLIQDIDPAQLYKHKMQLTIQVDPGTGKAYAYAKDCAPLDGTVLKKNTKRKVGRKKKTPSFIEGTPYDYKKMKQLAETFDAVMEREFIETDGIYKATILDDDLTDFNQNDFSFLPMLLSDGRKICPEIRTDAARSKPAIEILEKLGIENDLRRRTKMFPGVTVTLYFTPSKRSEKMILRVLKIEDDTLQIDKCRIAYYRKGLIATGIVPASEAKMSLVRMDQAQLARYEEALKQAEARFYANARKDE